MGLGAVREGEREEGGKLLAIPYYLEQLDNDLRPLGNGLCRVLLDGPHQVLGDARRTKVTESAVSTTKKHVEFPMY